MLLRIINWVKEVSSGFGIQNLCILMKKICPFLLNSVRNNVLQKKITFFKKKLFFLLKKWYFIFRRNIR